MEYFSEEKKKQQQQNILSRAMIKPFEFKKKKKKNDIREHMLINLVFSD